MKSDSLTRLPPHLIYACAAPAGQLAVLDTSVCNRLARVAISNECKSWTLSVQTTDSTMNRLVSIFPRLKTVRGPEALMDSCFQLGSMGVQVSHALPVSVSHPAPRHTWLN